MFVSSAERLLVERNHVDVAGLEPCDGEAGIGGTLRECGVVLDAGESLLLDRGDDGPVDHERRGGVVEPARDTQNVHLVGLPARSCRRNPLTDITEAGRGRAVRAAINDTAPPW